MNSTFLLLFWPEVFEQQPLFKDNMCGRIFLLAAEFLGDLAENICQELATLNSLNFTQFLPSITVLAFTLNAFNFTIH
jgi:hypothetical protein